MKFNVEMKSMIEKHRFKFLFIIFFLILAFGIYIVSDFGISWDEDIYREITRHIYSNLFLHGTFIDHPVRHYGPFLELCTLFLEELFGLSNYREIYIMRHSFVFLIFLFLTNRHLQITK